MQVLLHSDNNGYSTQKTENGAPLSRRRDSRSTSFTVYSSRRHAKLEPLLNPSGAQYLGPIDWPILVRLNCGWVSDTKEPESESEHGSSELESPMASVKIEQKSYE